MEHLTRTLPGDAEAAARSLSRAIAVRGARPTPEVMRAVAHAIGTAARRDAMLPEQLIVALKQQWSASEVGSGTDEREAASWVLAELVSLCIHEYYGQEPGTRA